MKRPPLLMKMKYDNGKHKFGLWLPLFLLLPVILVVLLVLSPLILIVALVLWPTGWGRWALQSVGAACSVFCSMHGLEVDVRTEEEAIYIAVV